MAIESIGNRVQNLTSPFDATQNKLVAAPSAVANRIIGTPSQDTFTPSALGSPAQTAAQEAGIFQVGQSVATSQGEGAPAPAASTTASANTVAPQTIASVNSSLPASASQTATGASGVAQSPAATGVVQAELQIKLQALNAALPALGLTSVEIHQIDRIAALIQNFNPAAYVSLVNQFEALAQQAAKQSAANGGAPASNTTGPAAIGANAAGGGFRALGITIQFSGSQGAADSGSGNGVSQGAANNNQINPAGVQIAQAQFTFADGNGQTVKVQVPQLNSRSEIASQHVTSRHATAILASVLDLQSN